MQQPLPHTKPPKKPLPFPAWVEKTYPKKTPVRSFLHIIGALDIAYMVYRMKMDKQPPKVSEPKKHSIPPMPLKVEDHKKIEDNAEPELNIEFEIEPEPLIAHTSPSLNPSPEGRGTSRTPPLEDIDLLKTKQALILEGISLALEPIYGSDEEETALVINNISWRAFLPSPELNLSKMLQVARMSDGELYVLGRMALGAMSGEGYVTADDLLSILRSLAETKEKTCTVEVPYYDKWAGSKKRTAHTIHIRFQRV